MQKFFSCARMKIKQEDLKMLTYDLIVIGFGKAGKTLAGKLASAGKKLPLSNVVRRCTAVLVSISVVSQLKLC